MEQAWVWAVMLLVLGVGLAVLEVFFPSAGILAFLSAASVFAAIIMGFRQGPAVGLAMLGVSVVGIPAIVILAFRYWPKTAMGKRVLLSAPTADDVLPDDPDRRRLKGMVGKIGRAKCRMLPGGVVAIEGHNVEAVSEGMVVEVGQAVRVIKVQANRVVVRLVDEESPSPTAENPLERPIDSIVTDPFQEPPA
jgi:membrane-bound ClpP family serine protease